MLVENGVLKNYLLSRQPTEGFLKSNGHGRSQGNRKPIARMANLLVESKKQVSDEELKKMLVAEAKRKPGWLGVQPEETDKGLVVVEAVAGSPAAKAGLKKGDLLLKLNDTAIRKEDDLKAFMSSASAGQELDVTIGSKP